MGLKGSGFPLVVVLTTIADVVVIYMEAVHTVYIGVLFIFSLYI